MADEVRRTRLAPAYGHPAHLEIASGTGPCRCCLRKFTPGTDRRLLFTYRPPETDGCLMAPGPVFIHAEHCEAFAGDGFPEGLRSLPLAFEARASGGRVVEISARQELSAEAQMSVLFEEMFAQWLHVRHAVAGCYIARVDRVRI
ncbi:MAG TPA: DUF1203 domain-containing protein [Steroidobacteraceae bacterium]|nr:DUF1203 domain-containing protein [Steroidobacteraceae bacterium]